LDTDDDGFVAIGTTTVVAWRASIETQRPQRSPRTSQRTSHCLPIAHEGLAMTAFGPLDPRRLRLRWWLCMAETSSARRGR